MDDNQRLAIGALYDSLKSRIDPDTWSWLQDQAIDILGDSDCNPDVTDESALEWAQTTIVVGLAYATMHSI